MRSFWLNFLNEDHHPHSPLLSDSELDRSCAKGREKCMVHSLFLESIFSRLSQISGPRGEYIQKSLKPLIQVRAFLSHLIKGTLEDSGICESSSSPLESIGNLVDAPYLTYAKLKSNENTDHEAEADSACKQGALSALFPRIDSLATGNLWNQCRHLLSFCVSDFAGTFVPLHDTLSLNQELTPLHAESTKCKEGKSKSSKGFCELPHLELWHVPNASARDNDFVKNVTEPRTRRNFPTFLPAGNLAKYDCYSTSKVLVGFGSKSVTVAKVKSLYIYAFGLYVHPISACKQMSKIYFGLNPEELKTQPDFFEEILRQDLQMTLRLVVHYRGLKLATVRNVFETSLRKRLRKIKGVPHDDGLTEFCDYFSKDLSLSPGTTIDFHRLSGGKLRTEVCGQEIGTIHSSDFCRAFFDMYIGENPVSFKTKEDIGENIAHVLRRC